MSEVVYRRITWRNAVLVAMKWHLSDTPEIPNDKLGLENMEAYKKVCSDLRSVAHLDAARMRSTFSRQKCLSARDLRTKVRTSTQFFRPRKDGWTEINREVCADVIQFCRAIHSWCVKMEGSNNKPSKSRLFTSNVLLQKDELEEVSPMKHKYTKETETGRTLCNLFETDTSFIYRNYICEVLLFLKTFTFVLINVNLLENKQAFLSISLTAVHGSC